MDSLGILADVSRGSVHVSGAQLTIGLISGLLVLACVLVHYETMSWISRRVILPSRYRRVRIVLLILVMLVAHVVELWLFGITYWVLDTWPRFGELVGSFDGGLLDFIYFSAMSYTTVGFGDVVPTGAIRVLCGTEALVGLSLITWSASLAFLEMQRDWDEFRRH